MKQLHEVSKFDHLGVRHRYRRRRLAGLNLLGANVVEVGPPYHHAHSAAVAACHTAYDLISLLAARYAVWFSG